MSRHRAGWFVFLVVLLPVAATAQSLTFVSQFGRTGTPSLTEPFAVAFTPEGGVLVADRLVPAVYQYSRTGAFIATWPHADLMEYVADMDVSHSGELFVLDDGKRVIFRFSPTGDLLGTWPCSSDGRIHSLCVDASAVYVGYFSTSRIEVYSHEGVLLATWSLPANSLPWAMDATDDAIYIADRMFAKILRYAKSGAQLSSLSLLDPGYSEPTGVAVGPQGHVFVSDVNNGRIQVLSPDGSGSTFGSTCVLGYSGYNGCVGAGEGQFHWPSRLAASSHGLAVIDELNTRIQVFDIVPVAVEQQSWSTVKQIYR